MSNSTLFEMLKIQKQAHISGFKWTSTSDVIAKLDEEILELKEVLDQGMDVDRLKDEFGDILFTAVNLSRHLNLDLEEVMSHSIQKFSQRFSWMLLHCDKESVDFSSLSLEEMHKLWVRAKLNGKVIR